MIRTVLLTLALGGLTAPLLAAPMDSAPRAKPRPVAEQVTEQAAPAEERETAAAAETSDDPAKDAAGASVGVSGLTGPKVELAETPAAEEVETPEPETPAVEVAEIPEAAAPAFLPPVSEEIGGDTLVARQVAPPKPGYRGSAEALAAATLTALVRPRIPPAKDAVAEQTAAVAEDVEVGRRTTGLPEALPKVRAAVAATLRPAARPGQLTSPEAAGRLASLVPLPRPHVLSESDPDLDAETDTGTEVAGDTDLPAEGMRRSPRPSSRPDGLAPARRAQAPRSDEPRLTTAAAVAPARVRPPFQLFRKKPEGLCGSPGIAGEVISPIAGKISGCGVEAPVKVTAIDGVTLTQPATIDCTTAIAVQKWLRSGVEPVVGRLGGGVKALRVAAHYSCRPRNNQKGAKISEHGRGRAIDISGIILANGTEMSVLKGWRDQQQGPLMKAMHKAACGPFGTVLGPNSDRFHQDHFHLDTARYRNGSYCR